MASSERVFKLLDTPIEITSPAQPQKAVGKGRIEFDHVWFAYRQLEILTRTSHTGMQSASNGHGTGNHDAEARPC